MDGEVKVQIFNTLRLFEQPDVDRLFAVLEERLEMAPTHWGESKWLRDPYDRTSILKYMDVCRAEGERGEGALLVIRRLVPPRYDLTTSASYAANCSLTLSSGETPDPSSLPLYFALGSRLASGLDAEYGFVDIEHADVERTKPERGFLADYAEVGPGDVRRRTFFGPRLLELMQGSQAFEGSGLLLRPWGRGVQADIADPPWEGDGHAVLQKRRVAMNVLRKTGVFYDYNDGEIEPGPKWLPPPRLKRSKVER